MRQTVEPSLLIVHDARAEPIEGLAQLDDAALGESLALRNQIGGLRTFLGLVQALPQMKPQQRVDDLPAVHTAPEMLTGAFRLTIPSTVNDTPQHA